MYAQDADGLKRKGKRIMKKSIQFLSFLVVVCLLFTSCSQTIGGLFNPSSNSTTNPNGGVSTVNPQGSTVTGTPSKDIIDVSSDAFSQGTQIKDQDGNLLVPFDVAYPEIFATSGVEYNPDVLLLKLGENFGGAITKELVACGFSSLEKFLNTKNGDWYRAYLAENVNIADAMKAARSLDAVLMADYDYVYETEAIDYDSVVCSNEVETEGTEVEDNDEAPFICKDDVKGNKYWKDMFHLDKNQLQKAWKYLEDNGISAGGSSSVVVAVIDTGVDYTHPDLKANMWINRGEIPGNGIDDDGNGYVDDVHGVSTTGSTYNHTGDPMDDHGHGTHVAGIIGATNNKEGIVGIAYNVKIMAIKAGQATGVFNQSDIAEAILYAYEMGADVINMSFGGSACSIAVQDALMTAYTTATLVASAGNDGMYNEGFLALPNYPAALSYVIGVMSVDANGVESGFTNYDVLAFNSIEYEIYAPGEQIMSTLPDGRYGKLSGTSMAAPIVSAAAALLRSYFTDRDMYPSKFIAAQLCATSQDTAICCNPKDHGIHNLPMLLNVEDALKKLPKPDINAYDFYVFDFVEYEGVEYPENNGDGVADAGETLFIGVVMRNRWGMSRDTIVTIDTLGSLGVNNPYVEIINGTVNFDSIGTYSTKSTLIYNDENIITGISDPFIVKLAKNTPNDYLIGINVYATYGNALDEKDTTVYQSGKPSDYQVNFWARNGVILPSQITEDMTLTKDNYYIIPNSTYIAEDVTVTVEPGTQIQFWSDDPSDPYASTYIAYLNVAGSFICQGTEDEPVQLFPSDMMSAYRVEIQKTSTGKVNLSYTTVTNPYMYADYVDHCTFKYNYARWLNWRELSNGVVNDIYWYGGGLLDVTTAENCLFYKCGSAVDFYGLFVRGNFISCSFVDSNIELTNHSNKYTNCVFMGNSAQNEYGDINNSTLTMYDTNIKSIDDIVRNNETGTTYISININVHSNGEFLDYVRNLAQNWGGDIACFETKEEWNFIKNQRLSGFVGIRSMYDDTWVNGEPIGDYIDTRWDSSGGDRVAYFYYSNYIYNTNSDYKYIIEIPGSIYLDIILLRENFVKIDNESTYQITAWSVPNTFDKSELIYISEDENVATVSENGIVIPVSEGSTRIFVYSPDYMVYDVLELQVVDKVSLYDVTFGSNSITIEVGKSVELTPVYSPVNTTERTITYTSSDPEIASVDQHGVIRANKNGTAIITATAQNGTVDEITVKVISVIESISFGSNLYATTVGDTDDSWKLEIYPANASDFVIKYESSNPEVAYVDANGNLVRVSEGFARIRASVVGTDFYDEIEISVSESLASFSDIVCMDENNGHILAVTSDGSLWVWGGSQIRVPAKIADGVKSAVFGRTDYCYSSSMYYYISYVDKNGELKVFDLSWNKNGVSTRDYPIDSAYQLTNIASIQRQDSAYYALTNDGALWVIGDNSRGQLGVGTTTSLATFAMCGIVDIKEIVPYNYSVAILKNNGDLYMAGTNYNKYLVPTKLDSNVTDIRGGTYSVLYDKTDGSQYHLDYWYASPYAIPDSYGKVQLYASNDDTFYSSNSVYFKDGKLYYRGDEIKGISTVEEAFYLNGSFFIVAEDGELYGFGGNTGYQLADLTSTNRFDRAEKIYFGIKVEDSAPAYSGSNAEFGTIYDETIVIDFDHAVRSGSYFGYITLKNSAGVQLAMTKDVRLDKLTLTPIIPFASGEEYSIEIPEGAFVSAFGATNSAVTITFTYLDDRSIEVLSSSLTDGEILEDATLNAEIEFSYAIVGDAFDQITLILDGEIVDGLVVELKNYILHLSISNLIPGEYILTIPVGALKDNIGGVSPEMIYNLVVPEPEEEVYVPLEIVYSSIGSREENMALNPMWIVVMNKEFTLDSSLITLKASSGDLVHFTAKAEGNVLTISASNMVDGATYTITVSEGAMTDELGAVVGELSASFTTVKFGERFFWTSEYILNEFNRLVREEGFNPAFYGNAILNNFNDTNVEHWLRIIASSGSINEKIGVGRNWWGTILEDMIERQIVDFDDYQSLMDIVVGEYLTVAPSNTFPFVTAAYLLNADGERVNRVSNETVTFVVEFNRDMDTSIPLRVRFGSSEPYAEYEIEGSFVTPRRWEGVYTLKTTIENGRQFIRIENGAAADDAYLILCETPGRFGFEIDTTAAQALTMLGEATATGIKLTWTQDDFDTLAGYNVYRSDREDGYYTRLNDYVIPADIKEFFDDTVEPGKRYYYNFTVVKTDLTESTPSGKISIVSMDTMAPDIYHSPVRTAYTGSNLLISATVTDNLALNKVTIYYRTVGSTEWKSTQMTANNSRYTGLILAENVTLDGIEYYIEAYDGNNTTTKGSASAPYSVTVKLAVDANALGDVDGDGVITNKDALMLLQAANDLLNLTEEQFLRADINGDGELSAAEALRILQYVSGKVTTIV